MDETPKQTSTFNEGVQQIIRLDRIWTSARTNREAGRLGEWRWNLDSGEIELAYDIIKHDDTENKFEETLTDMNKEITSLTTAAISDKKKNVELYNKLKEKEIFLRKIQNKAGKGAKFRDEDEDDM